MGLILILLAEILLFNGPSLASLFYHPVDLTDRMNVSVNEEGLTEILMEDLDLPLHLLYLDAEIPDSEPLVVTLRLTDEGNTYPYVAGEAVMAAKTPKSRYLRVHPYGKVRSILLTLNPGGTDTPVIKGITADPRRPLFFNLPRVLLCALLFAFFYGLRNQGNIMKINCSFDRKQRLIIISCVLLTILLGLFLTGSHKLLNEASKPHHQQYKELAHALKEGSVALPYEPSEGLLNAKNPYDTIRLQAEGIEYLADYAYHNGKYYVYFGLIPELCIYFPYYLLTGKDFPNHAAVFLFYALFSAGVFVLYAQFIRRYFKMVPFAVYLMLSAGTVLSPTFAYVLFTADLYSVPIMAGLAFLASGLALYLTGLDSSKKVTRVLCYALGSLFVASVAGCRPQMLLFGLVAIPFFWKEVFERHTLIYVSKENRKQGIPETLALVLPVVAVAALVMIYNASRFGSPFDFGATYSLTNNDMNHRGFSPERVLRGLGTFLFALPSLSGRFPFLYSSDLGLLNSGYLGRIVTEFLLGGVMIVNILSFVILLLPRFGKELGRIRLLIPCLMMLGSSCIIGMADADAAGILQRYSADMAFGILFVTAVLFFFLTEFFAAEYENIRVLDGAFDPLGMTFSLIKTGFVIMLFVSLFTVANTEGGITLLKYNPELFYAMGSVFTF